jgi:ABC-type phosphate transport system substrate-binding protein
MGAFLMERLQSMQRIVYLLIALSAIAISSARAEVVAIVGANSSVTELSKGDIADIFLGKTSTLPKGGSVTPIDLPESSALREQFYQAVAGKSAAQVKSYWARMAFTGKGTPPKEGKSIADVKKMVSINAGKIGYIDKSDVDDSVKIIFHAN